MQPQPKVLRTGLLIACKFAVSGIVLAALIWVANLSGDAGTAKAQVLCDPGLIEIISPPPPPTGTVGALYSHTFVVSGTAVGFTSTGTLPPNVMLDTAAGTLSGTLTATGVFSNIVVTALGLDQTCATQTFTITVVPTPTIPTLIIKADDKRMQLGFAVPELTATYTGFLPGDTPESLDTPAILSTVVPTREGVFPITVCCASDPSYNIIFIDGTLTVVADRGGKLPSPHKKPMKKPWKDYCPQPATWVWR
jgi:hypothetical protein